MLLGRDRKAVSLDRRTSSQFEPPVGFPACKQIVLGRLALDDAAHLSPRDFLIRASPLWRMAAQSSGLIVLDSVFGPSSNKFSRCAFACRLSSSRIQLRTDRRNLVHQQNDYGDRCNPD